MIDKSGWTALLVGALLVCFVKELAPGVLDEWRLQAGTVVEPTAQSDDPGEPETQPSDYVDTAEPSPAASAAEQWSRYRFSSDACSDPSLGRLEQTGPLSIGDIFELNLVADDLPASFKRQLEQRLLNVFRFYRAMLGRQHLRRVALNLRLFADRERYEQYILAQGADDVHSQGVYFGRSISGAVHVRHPRQGLSTTVHEAVHAINHALLGVTPRWLNEGLAEYLEMVDGGTNGVIVKPNRHWLNRDGTFRYEFYDFTTLTDSEAYWLPGAELRRVLYGNSWHWVHFLMDAPHRIRLLSGLLIAELAEPCSPMDSDAYYQLLTDGDGNIETDFIDWQGGVLKAQSFTGTGT